MRNCGTTIFGSVYRNIYAIAAWICLRAKIRFIEAPMIYEHIGHLAGDFDSYLKDQILSGQKVRSIFLCAGRKPANETLVAHWSKHILFVRNESIERVLRPLMSYRQLVVSLPAARYFNALEGAARGCELQARWADRDPLLRLSDEEIVRGEAQLRALGIPEGAWFVCVHCREPGFLAYAEWANSHRNVKIGAYREAMLEVVARGGWCVRVGDASMQPLEPMSGVVDYAVSSFKSDWMDVFLCARCRFFLGSGSGLMFLAGIFGRPIATANMAPMGCAYSPFPSDVSIPKLVADAQGRILNFPDLFADEASSFQFAPDFEKRELRVIDNSPEEILELAVEMMERLKGRLVEEADDIALQAGFRALVKPHHYCWGAGSRVGRGFLRRHRELLGPNVSANAHRATDSNRL